MSPSLPASSPPLRTRLRRILLATSIVSLTLASGAYLTFDYLSFRHGIETRLQVLTGTLAPGLARPLQQRDRRGASEVLARLAIAHQIISATLFTEDGALLARYLRPDAPDEIASRPPPPQGLRSDQGDLTLSLPLVLEGKRMGTLALRADQEEGAQRLRLNLVIVGVTLIFILPVTYILSEWMIGAITGSMSELVEVVNAVTTRRDYSLRALKKGPDELAVLIEGINDMLSQIQVRDGALTLARNELENRVAERTAELTFVNQELSNEISERKRMESSLRESEERYRQLVEFSPDAILILDGHRTLFVNGAALRMFGARSQAELTGSSFRDRVAPEFRDLFAARLREVTQEHRGTPPLEERFLRMDGSPIDGEVQETPFIYLGQPAVQVVIRDISKRKEIERMKDEFVSTVSHELRTPLTSIQGSLGLVANGVTGALPPAAKPLVDIAYKNCGRLILLINDILDSEKIAAGKMQFALREQELMPLLEQAIESNRAFGAQFNVRFEMGESIPGARVEVDPDRMIQVLTNLLSNAAKFSPRGDSVTISARRRSGWIQIAVTDRGQGIPAEFRDRIFQKFSQADSSDRRAKGGTGLGLSISKAIVEKHAGALTFTSEVGKGTTFFVELPERPAPGALPPAPAALVCDDEPPVGELIRTLLEREGIRTTVVETLAEARALLRKNAFTLLALDHLLSDGSGIDFIRELRSSDSTRRLPVLLLSPWSGAPRELPGADEQVQFLEKPIDRNRMAAAAKAACARPSPSLEGAKP